MTGAALSTTTVLLLLLLLLLDLDWRGLDFVLALERILQARHALVFAQHPHHLVDATRRVGASERGTKRLCMCVCLSRRGGVIVAGDRIRS